MYLGETLDEEMIKAGADLTLALDKVPMAVKASLWLFFPETRTWKLIIATPQARSAGPKQVYGIVGNVLSKMKRTRKGIIASEIRGDVISLGDVTVVDSEDPLIILLGKAIGTDKGISNIRFSRNTVDGQFIEDAYIYRLVR